MANVTQVRKWILKGFQLHGYSIRADASSFLSENLLPLAEFERQKWLDSILNHIQQLNLESPIVDKTHVDQVLQKCTQSQSSTDSIFGVINAFDIPAFKYNPDRNKFEKEEQTNPELFTSAKEKCNLLKRRYMLLRQRTLRHELFKQNTLTGHQSAFQLRNIEWYLCSSGRIENTVVLGLLVSVQEGYYAIEDQTGVLKLDLSEAKFHDGLFPEHCFILAEGVYEDKTFYVHGLGFPPAEPELKTRPYFGTLNTFGGPSDKNLRQSIDLLKLQDKLSDEIIVFISDVWLDKIKVLEKLKTLFSGFSEDPPTAFVLMGNFLSTQCGSSQSDKLKTALTSLGEIISSVPNICDKSHIILIPGPSDIGSPLILPRPALSRYLAAGLLQHVPKTILATNPCRIQYCTREIIVIREDLLTKLCRNTIHFPKTDEIYNHFVKTVACQATLVPMSFNICPVYWSYSHSMNLYPLPNLVVIGDQLNPFTTEYMGCSFTNPGSFMKNEFSFRVYFPSKNSIEESVIPAEE